MQARIRIRFYKMKRYSLEGFEHGVFNGTGKKYPQGTQRYPGLLFLEDSDTNDTKLGRSEGAS